MRICLRFINLLFLFLIVISGQACVKNRLTSSWVDQSFKGPVKGKILVIGIFKDPTTHKIFEDSFVESLVKAGADAIPSYLLWPRKREAQQRMVAPDSRAVRGVICVVNAFK